MSNHKIVHPEIATFADLWKGGYYEGDPMDPVGRSSYKRYGYLSVLHATYLGCVKPYIKSDSLVLEIGPGRGAWTKCMLNAKEVWCLDAKSREENEIDRYLGRQDNLFYHQVNDFSCSILPDNYFTFMFSFGTFCHISFDGLSQYAGNIYPKLKNGARCFWMVSDYDQFNNISMNFSQYDIMARTLPSFVLNTIEVLNRVRKNRLIGPPFLNPLDKNESNDVGSKGRWYNNGLDRTVDLLTEIGYEVIDKDMGFALRDPIVHFMKP